MRVLTNFFFCINKRRKAMILRNITGEHLVRGRNAHMAVSPQKSTCIKAFNWGQSRTSVPMPNCTGFAEVPGAIQRACCRNDVKWEDP